MAFTQKHNDLIYGALEIFLENDSPSIVRRAEKNIHFVTVLGFHGDIIENSDGNWDIIVERSIVYTIENSVFELITQENDAPNMEELVERVIELGEEDLHDKSKILLKNILEGIAHIVVDSNPLLMASLQNKFLLN